MGIFKKNTRKECNYPTIIQNHPNTCLLIKKIGVDKGIFFFELYQNSFLKYNFHFFSISSK